MRFFRYAFLLFVPLLFTTANAQTVTGKWRGHLTQEPGVLYGDYYYEMELTQKGDSVTGVARIYAEENFAVMPLRAKFDGKNFVFQEQKMDDHKIRVGYEWCIKHGTLAYYETSGEAHLEGPWDGTSSMGNCNPGRIYLKRAIDKPKDPIKDSVIVRTDSTTSDKIVIGSDKVKKIFDRQPKTGRTVTVKKGATIKIRFSDNAKVDGDSISFYYNDKLLIEHYSLVQRAKTIELKLDDSASVHALILYAENLGSIPPNTALVEIDDGVNKQTLNMDSDLDRCDIIYLKPR